MTACTVGDASLPEGTEGEDFRNPNGGLRPDAGTDAPDTEPDAPSDEPQPPQQPEPQPPQQPPPSPPSPPPVDPGALPVYPTAHPRIYLGANKLRLQAALAANAPSATRFKAKIDQWLGGASIWGLSVWNGALLSQLTGNAAYCTKAVSTIETQVVAAEAQIAAGQRPEVALNSYLHIGEMVGDLALVYDWCFTNVTPAQRTRWIAYANQAVSNVWDPTGARWGTTAHPWTGWSVNNPSNNYYYSFLRATMLVGLATRGENASADAFLTRFRDQKIMAQLVPTFAADLTGGGSREGTGYGVAMRNLFELYDWWLATTGESLATKSAHTRASMLTFLHQAMPTLDKIAPTGDHARDRTAPFFDYHRHYLQLLIALYPADPLAGRAKQMIASSNVPVMGQPFMYVYDFLYESPVAASSLAGLNTTHHVPGIGQIYARSGWDNQATWVNLTAGPYTESHAHQDQGSLMIYKG
ncbi:MAG: hypothetical protein H0T42_06065, partial [Deltaproteobacteria bacterium]|nr:hypothetical protein [Deltaproteobacteria bacterium]